MPDINLDCDYFDHPKTRRLIGLLGRGAAELPLRLWTYCGKFHPESGRLAGHSAQEIESIVQWWGKSGDMVNAMLRVGFIEEEKDGTLSVHNFKDRQGHIAALKERGKKAAVARWAKLRGDATSNAQTLLEQSSLPAVPAKPAVPTKKKAAETAAIPSDLEASRIEIEDWLAYKREKGQTYKAKGLEALWRKFREIPPPRRRGAVDHSMANNYQGLFEPKGGKNGAPSNSFRSNQADGSGDRRQDVVVL